MESLNKKVIIFDDDEDILSICTYILEEQNWQVQTYTDTKDIVERVASFKPAIIFMDNWIPDEGGIVATQILKGNADVKNTPVIYFSANTDIESLAAKAGANAYLAKPFELDDLEIVIQRVLQQPG
ncbi:MAG: response regulator [Pedobacter sp.]|uniref:response regulator n=1 Tax=Pedobacter sp. TaxID=1411316 RepID=UPI003399A58B